ncbi:hypothetical protein AK830_g3870 [Neonectria ditissima]|uniref:NACHT domain-containing protein n=1 Tax=Neonectria ditissima TaxID=78410 RepID=A0A0P7BQB0_9HYPO|nr:hypothetical protein AK830_g3870 [Neonectria ditissima]
MASFPFLRTLADRSIEPHQALWSAFVLCCVLIASASIATWRKWFSENTSSPHARVRFSRDEDDTSPGRDANTALRNRNIPRPLTYRLSYKNAPPRAEYPIQVLYESSNAAIDIVAVHGLAANPDYAWVWQPKNNPPDCPGYPKEYFNWLKDLLPTKLSSGKLPSRVMTFNYDSTWLMKAPQQRLSNISDQLLDSLRNKREKGAAGRPVIFIGHSFGGNLIQQAIVSASQQGSRHSDIAESTAGVVFLGTPHRGSAAATWGALIASLAPSQLAFEKRILVDLEKQSSSLVDRLHSFSQWLFVESVPVVCFFESLVTDYTARMGLLGKVLPAPKILVVPEESACIDGHHKMSLPADHFKINKFYGPDDPSFNFVYPEIERMTRDAEQLLRRRRCPETIPSDQRAASGTLQQCLQQMRVTNPRDILSYINTQKGKRTGKTCEWILKREEFAAWGGDSENSRLLRLIGPPGIGKTMMSTYLTEVIKTKVQKTSNRTFAYFFFDDKNQERRTPTTLLRSLIWQLLLQNNELFRHIQPDFEKHESGRVFEDLLDNLSALWRMFEAMLRDQRAGEVFILIDALDECDKSTREALIISLNNLFTEELESGGKFKFLITSRPELSGIESELLDEIGVSLRVDSSSVNADLSDYINVSVDELARRKRYSATLKEEVKQALRGQAGGTFLWVSLMLSELKSTPKYEVSRRLQHLPQGLDATYIRILDDNIPKERQEDARFLLLAMVGALRPLKDKEMAASFALWKDDTMVQTEDLDDYMDICSSCSSIICLVPDDRGEVTLNFCHQSVKDFLLRNRDSSNADWFRTSMDDANSLLFHISWRYLSSDRFESFRVVRRGRRKLGIPLPASIYGPSYAFFVYAHFSWEEHAVAGYPALLENVEVDIMKSPMLRDAWFHVAARNGQLQAMQFLLTKDADLTALNDNGSTPLTLAAERSNLPVLKFLLAVDNIDVNIVDQKQLTALAWAATRGNETIVRLLLAEDHIDVNKADRTKISPLIWAIRNNHETTVKLLLASDHIDIAKRRHNYKQSIADASKLNNETIFKLLIAGQDLHTPSDDRLGRTLYKLAPEGLESALELLLATEGLHPNWRDKQDRGLLSYAAEWGQEAVVKLLLTTESIDLDVKDRTFGYTPLAWAAHYGHESIVNLLLATKGVDVNSRDYSLDRTPIALVAMNGHQAIVRLLLERADLNAEDAVGRTPLSLATINGHTDVVIELLTHDSVKPDTADRYGSTPLSLAARHGHTNIAEALLATGRLTCDSKDFVGRTPLWWARARGSDDIARALLDFAKARGVLETEADICQKIRAF